MHTDTIRVMLLPDEEGFVAKCYEYDIEGSGKTKQEAKDSFIYFFTGVCRVGLKNGELPTDALQKHCGGFGEISNDIAFYNKMLFKEMQKEQDPDVVLLDGCKGFGVPYIAEFYGV